MADDPVKKVEQDIQQTQQQITEQKQKIAVAKKEFSTPIKAPELTRAQIRGLTRTQKAQIKGQISLAEQQRKAGLKQILIQEKTFQKQATTAQTQIVKTQKEIAAYKKEAEKIKKENREWDQAKRLVFKGGRSLWLERKYASSQMKRKIDTLLEKGYQTAEQMKKGIFPEEYLSKLKKSPEVKEFIKVMKDIDTSQQIIDFEISKAHGAVAVTPKRIKPPRKEKTQITEIFQKVVTPPDIIESVKVKTAPPPLKKRLIPLPIGPVGIIEFMKRVPSPQQVFGEILRKKKVDLTKVPILGKIAEFEMAKKKIAPEVPTPIFILKEAPKTPFLKKVTDVAIGVIPGSGIQFKSKLDKEYDKEIGRIYETKFNKAIQDKDLAYVEGWGMPEEGIISSVVIKGKIYYKPDGLTALTAPIRILDAVPKKDAGVIYYNKLFPGGRRSTKIHEFGHYLDKKGLIEDYDYKSSLTGYRQVEQKIAYPKERLKTEQKVASFKRFISNPSEFKRKYPEQAKHFENALYERVIPTAKEVPATTLTFQGKDFTFHGEALKDLRRKDKDEKFGLTRAVLLPSGDAQDYYFEYKGGKLIKVEEMKGVLPKKHLRMEPYIKLGRKETIDITSISPKGVGIKEPAFAIGVPKKETVIDFVPPPKAPKEKLGLKTIFKILKRPPQDVFAEAVGKFLVKKDIDITKPIFGVKTPLTMIKEIELGKRKLEPETPTPIFFGKKFVTGVVEPLAGISEFGLKKVATPVVKFMEKQEFGIPFLKVKPFEKTPQERIATIFKSHGIDDAKELKRVGGIYLTPIIEIEEARLKEKEIEPFAKKQYAVLGEEAKNIKSYQDSAEKLGETPLTQEANTFVEEFNKPGISKERQEEIYNRYETFWDKNKSEIEREQKIIEKKEALFEKQKVSLGKIKSYGFAVEESPTGDISFENKYVSLKELEQLRPGWQEKNVPESAIKFFERKFLKGFEETYTDIAAGLPRIRTRKPIDEIEYTPVQKFAGKGVSTAVDISTYFVPGIGNVKLFGPTVEKGLKGELREFAKEEPLEVGLAVGIGTLKGAVGAAKFFKAPIKRIPIKAPPESVLKKYRLAEPFFKRTSRAEQVIAIDPTGKGQALFRMRTTIPGRPYVDITRFQQVFYKIPKRGAVPGGIQFAQLKPRLPVLKTKSIPITGVGPSQVYISGTTSLTPLKISRSGKTTGVIARYRIGKEGRLVNYAELSFKGKGKAVTIHTLEKLRPFEKEQITRVVHQYGKDIFKEVREPTGRIFVGTGTARATPITTARKIRAIKTKVIPKKPVVTFGPGRPEGGLLETPVKKIKFEVFAGKARQTKLASIARLEADLPGGVEFLTGETALRETTRIAAKTPTFVGDTGIKTLKTSKGVLYYHKEGSKIVIDSLEVAKKFRGQKVGTQLIKSLSKKFPNRAISLQSTPEAKGFFEAIGFTEKETIGKGLFSKVTRFEKLPPKVTTGARLETIKEFILYKGPKGKPFVVPKGEELLEIGKGFRKIKTLKLTKATIKKIPESVVKTTNLKALAKAKNKLSKTLTKAGKTQSLTPLSKTELKLVERVHSAVSGAEATALTTIPTQAPVPRLITKTSQVPVVGLMGAVKEIQEPEVKIIQTPVVTTLQKPVEKAAVLEKQEQVTEAQEVLYTPGGGASQTVQKPEPTETPSIISPIIPPGIPSKVPTPKLKIIKFPPLPEEKKRVRKIVKKKKIKEGYNTLVKPLKKKRHVRANINPITEKKAMDLGSHITDTTLGASWKIKKAGKPAKKPKLKSPRGYYQKTKSKYRDYKIKKGKKVYLADQWIEKKNKRLDTPGEIGKVQVLAKIAKMKKAIKKAVPTPTKVRLLSPLAVRAPRIKTQTKFLGI